MSSLNAMIIDDSSNTRKVLMKTLHRTGLAQFEFTEAADGVEAMHLLVNRTPDIIFVDMNMPRMSGIEFVRCYRRQTRECPPIIMITAENRRERLSEAFRQIQVDAFMLKPLDCQRLTKGLATILEAAGHSTATDGTPFAGAAADAMAQTMVQACGVKLEQIEPDVQLRQGDCVFGAIALTGDLQWAVSAGFSRDTAQALSLKLAGREDDITEEDMGDAIGELTNMFASRLKACLAAQGVNVETSFATVAAANGLRTLVQKKQCQAVEYTQFQSPVGPLWTAISAGQFKGIIL